MSPPPDTAATDASFKTAYEDATFSPMSAKPRFEPQRERPREPEYIHMPWDHNTPILEDLPKLVKLIEARSEAGKKVLVHCQCGVSRSATLLIAYGMYKNPDKSMQDAYNSVKERSRWIGPNMSLIYQLTDWKKKIEQMRGKNAPNAMVKRQLEGRGGKGCRLSDPTPEPLTAPLPDRRSNPIPSPLVLGMEMERRPGMVRTRTEGGGFSGGVSPGPSSAPPGMTRYNDSEVKRTDEGRSKEEGEQRAPPTPQHRRTFTPQRVAPPPPPPTSHPAPTSHPVQPPQSQTPPLGSDPLFSPRTLQSSTSFPVFPTAAQPNPTAAASTSNLPSLTSPNSPPSYFTKTMAPNRRSGPWAGGWVDPRSPIQEPPSSRPGTGVSGVGGGACNSNPWGGSAVDATRVNGIGTRGVVVRNIWDVL